MTQQPRTTRTSIGPYDVVADLGTSPLGEVYLIRLENEPPYARVVMRELRADLVDRSELLPAILQPVQLAVALDHPNVAQTFGATTSNGRVYLATEYVDGLTWAAARPRLWSAGQLDWCVHVRLLAEVLAGLHAAHEMKVVHGAVCPAYVFLTDDGRVKVSGFGNAEAERRAGISQRATPAHRRPYTAPECFATFKFDVTSDLFAVGVMLWEALNGAPLEPGEAKRAFDGGARVPELPTALLAMCERALATNTALRPPSAAEFRDVLLSCLPSDSAQVDLRELARMARDIKPHSNAVAQGEAAAAAEPRDRALGEFEVLAHRSAAGRAPSDPLRLTPATASGSTFPPPESRSRSRWYALAGLMAPLLVILGWPRDAAPRPTQPTVTSAFPHPVELNTSTPLPPAQLAIDEPHEPPAQPGRNEDRVAEASAPPADAPARAAATPRVTQRPARMSSERPQPIARPLATKPQSVHGDTIPPRATSNHVDAGRSPVRTRTIYEEEPF